MDEWMRMFLNAMFTSGFNGQTNCETQAQKEAKKQAKKMMAGKFDLEDFLDHHKYTIYHW